MPDLTEILTKIERGEPISAPEIDAVTGAGMAYCVWSPGGPFLHLKDRGRKHLTLNRKDSSDEHQTTGRRSPH
jgi:hypothetical protein